MESEGVRRVADITMCSSVLCPMKDKCYRTKAKSDEYQSWSNFEYFCNENNGFCDYIPIKNEKNKK